MADTNIDIKQSKGGRGDVARGRSKEPWGELMRRRVMRRRVYGQQKERECVVYAEEDMNKKKRPTGEVDLSLNEASASEFQIIQQL